jgi:predicted transcriptional regulator
MLRKGKIPEKLYNLLKEYKGTVLDVKSLTFHLFWSEIMQRGVKSLDKESLRKEYLMVYQAVKRGLSRLAQRGLIRKVDRGKYVFQESGFEYLDPAQIAELAKKVLKLIIKVTGHSIPNTPKTMEILNVKLQDLVSSLIFQNP